MNRTNSVAGAQIGSLEGFDRVTENGTEYFVTDVVAQKEGVYYYPDPEGGVLRELAPAEELASAIDDVDEVDILIEHPDGPDETAGLTTDPRANFTEVGSWKELRETDDGKGIGGKTYIRANEVGNHNGILRRYLKQVSDLGAGEVSTGYSIDRSERSPGRYNGTAYDAIQRGINLDHLSLLPNEQGDCAVDDGCGLGRANADTLARVNNHIPSEFSSDVRTGPASFRFNASVDYKQTTEEISDDTEFTDSEWNADSVLDSAPNPSEEDDAPEYLDEIHAVSPTGDARDSKSNWKLPYKSSPDAPVNTRALVQIDSVLSGGRGGVDGLSSGVQDSIEQWAQRALKKAPDDLYGATEKDRENIFVQLGQRLIERIGSFRANDDTMDDQEKIDQLVEEYGLDRENVAHLAGEDCLDRIWSQFSEQGERNNENMGSGNNDDNGGDDLFTEEQEQRINEVVEESVPSAEEIASEIDVPSLDDEVDVDEIADKAAEKAAEKSEEVREHEQNIELIAQSDEYPGIDRDKAERMNKEVVSDLAEDIDEEPDEPSRGNRAGVPTGGSFDETEFTGDDDADVPVAGKNLVGGGGDE